VAHQASNFDKHAIEIGGRNPVTRRGCRELNAAPCEERIERDKKRVGPIASKIGIDRRNE
jgi:hypothetical protein